MSSDPVIPVLAIYCKGDMYAYNTMICGDGEKLNATWTSIPGRMGLGGRMPWVYTMKPLQQLAATD